MSATATKTARATDAGQVESPLPTEAATEIPASDRAGRDSIGTATETVSATLPWLAGGMSESVSSPSSIVGRLPDAELDRVLMAHWSRVTGRLDLLRAGSAISLFQQLGTVAQPIPEPAATLAAGIKLRICPKCGERPVRGPKRGECNVCHAAEMREHRVTSEAEKREALRIIKRAGLKVG